MDIFKTGRFYYNLLMLKNYLWIFLISMVPLIELRGAIPVSQAMQLPIIPSYIVCIIGNMIPVPVIYLFARKVLEWRQDKKYIGKIFTFCLERDRLPVKKCRLRQAADFLLHSFFL